MKIRDWWGEIEEKKEERREEEKKEEFFCVRNKNYGMSKRTERKEYQSNRRDLKPSRTRRCRCRVY